MITNMKGEAVRSSVSCVVRTAVYRWLLFRLGEHRTKPWGHQRRWRLPSPCGWMCISTFLLTLFATPCPVEAGPGECLPQPPAGQIYFCDPLDDGSSHYGTVVGGAFLDSGELADRGWRTSTFGDRIGYDLGTEVAVGTLSFWIRGIELSSTSLNNDNHHLVEMFDHGGHGAPDVCEFLGGIRVFGLGADAQWQGKVKFFMGSKIDASCGGEKNIQSFDTSQWQLDRWHHIEIEFGDGLGVFRFDGVPTGGTIDISTCPIMYRFLYLPNNPWIENAIDSVDGAVYANVSFSGRPACTEPCDDHNPCTEADACENSQCRGQPLPDGTPCDDQDPLTEGTLCSQGACLGECSPPEGATPVAEDQTVSVLWPDQPFPDASTLDVELAQDGSIEAVSYLKFHIPASDQPVESAILHVYCDSLSAPLYAGGSGGTVHEVRSIAWQEGSLTWNSRPAWEDVPLASLGTVEQGHWYDLDVTGAALSGGSISLALVPNGPDGAHYLSREGGSAGCLSPFLVITRAACDGECTDGQSDGDGGTEADADGSAEDGADGLDGHTDIEGDQGTDAAPADEDLSGGCGCGHLPGDLPLAWTALAFFLWVIRRRP